MRTAVIGAGLLGVDLARRIVASPHLDAPLVVGRDPAAAGLRMAKRLGCPTSAAGIDAAIDAGAHLVFDASNAAAHAAHWDRLSGGGAVLVDLTPSSAGQMVVPTVNGDLADAGRHLGLISCGGQVVLPVLHAVIRHGGVAAPRYVEVVTTAAAASVGRASRLNLDEYLATTGRAVSAVTGAERVKVLANITPAQPAPHFRADVAVQADDLEPDRLRAAVEAAADAVRAFAPGYRVASLGVAGDLLRMSLTVAASSPLLPECAGNVEIINAAAVLLGERAATAEQETAR